MLIDGVSRVERTTRFGGRRDERRYRAYDRPMVRVVWWEIESRDPEEFMRFHAGLSGWTFESAFAGTELGADYWVIHADERELGGLQRAASSASPSAGPRLYVEVDDLESALDRVVALGGSVERSRVELGGDDRWFGTYRDPTGISFGMWTANPAQR